MTWRTTLSTWCWRARRMRRRASKDCRCSWCPGASAMRGRWRDNDLRAVSLEHKMGIRASPTCVMALGEHGGARGWLVGELHNGLGCMFTLMNHMRIGVGPALHRRGGARPSAGARLRRGTPPGPRRPGRPATHHRACGCAPHAAHHERADSCRALSGVLRRRGAGPGPPAQRMRARGRGAERRLGLLTPLVKAWASDIAVEVSSAGRAGARRHRLCR